MFPRMHARTQAGFTSSIWHHDHVRRDQAAERALAHVRPRHVVGSHIKARGQYAREDILIITHMDTPSVLASHVPDVPDVEPRPRDVWKSAFWCFPAGGDVTGKPSPNPVDAWPPSIADPRLHLESRW